MTHLRPTAPGRLPWLPALALLIGWAATPLAAQDGSRQVELLQIVDDFDRGRFDPVLRALDVFIERADVQGDEDLLVDAYALRARTYLAVDSLDMARASVAELVRLDPSYAPDRRATLPFVRILRAERREQARTQTTTVSKSPEDARAAPATVLFLTQEDIRQRGYVDLEELLHDLPGFDIARGNGTLYSNIYQRGYRSSGTDRMLLLIDGVEENNIWAFNAYISRQYPLSNVQRVEVVYGPASTIYGANAFLGVVNVISKDPIDLVPDDRRFGVTAQTGVGSFDTRYADVTVAAVRDRMSFSATGRIYRSDEMDLSDMPEWDFQPPDIDHYRKLFEDDALASRARALDQQAFRNATVLGRPIGFSNETHDWLLSGRFQLDQLRLGFQTWRREEGSIGWFRDDYRGGAGNGATWIPRQTFFYARYDHRFTSRFSVRSFSTFKLHSLDDDNATLKLGDYASGKMNRDDLLAEVVPDWNLEYLHQVSRQFRTEVTAISEPTADLDLVAGIEFRSSLIQGDFNRSTVKPANENAAPITTIPGGNFFNSRDLGVYAQATYTPGSDVALTLGLRRDDNRIRSSGGYGTVLNSRVAAVVSPGRWMLKGIFSQAFKDADNRSRFAISPGSRDLANPTLKPERVNNVEASVGYLFDQGAAADVTWYSAYYSDAVAVQIVPYEGGTTGQNRNVGELHITGLQANLAVPYGRAEGYANYTYTRPRNTKPLDDQGQPRTDISDLRIGDIASHRVNLGINAPVWERLNLNVRLNWVGSRPTGPSTTVTANDTEGGRIDSYTVVHGVLTYDAPPLAGLAEGITAQLIVNNIFDARYFHPGVRSGGGEQASRLPQDERNLMVRLLVHF